MSSLLSIGKSGLLAAQVGLATTGNNITNASTPGYNRQVAIQTDTPSQDFGYGFVGTGTEVTAVNRVYDDFLARQLRGAESNQAQLNTYATQIAQVDNLLADPTAGLSPALQDFFNGVHDASSNPASAASRQALLSAADSLVGRFQGMGARLNEIATGVNGQITTTVNQINSYADTIAKLNDSIAALSSDPSKTPNDLLDQRDQALTELNKLVQTNVTPADNHRITVTFGTGQPLVVGIRSFPLGTSTSATDPSRTTVGYVNNGNFSALPDEVLTGGQLGGLVSFRDNALDRAQNSLGQVAAGLAVSFNAQHALGQDQNGAPGGAFFGPVNAYVGANVHNSPLSTTTVSAVVSDASKLTASDYSLDFDGTNFTVTRQSDGQTTLINPFPQAVPQTIDGVDYTINGVPQAGENFQVRPTYNAATSINVALTDRTKIALAAPIATSVPNSNAGSGKMSPGSVDQNYLTPGNALLAPLPLTYTKATGTLAGFPPAQDVTVVDAQGVSTLYPAGTPTIPYSDGMQISFGGVSFKISGAPADQDVFTVGPNSSNSVGDSRNGVLLAGLQSKNILDGGNATYQTTYAQMVNFVGNKAREAQISGSAADAAVNQATNAQQSVSGVNLDEEAANLLRYQQAYQAAGKVMQIASQLFDVLTSLGN